MQTERENAAREKKLLDEIKKLNELVENEKLKAERWERELHSSRDKIEEQKKEIKIRESELEVSHATY